MKLWYMKASSLRVSFEGGRGTREGLSITSDTGMPEILLTPRNTGKP